MDLMRMSISEGFYDVHFDTNGDYRQPIPIVPSYSIHTLSQDLSNDIGNTWGNGRVKGLNVFFSLKDVGDFDKLS